MSGLRAPVVAGIGGGVGTSTLAAALRAHDAGRTHVEIADILACRGTLDSLRRVAAVLERPGAAPPGPPPVLAVTLDGARLPRGPVRARLELLDGAVSAVVLLPHVARWRTIVDPVAEVAQLLAGPADRLPRPLRAYAAALREVAAAVATSGRLVSAGPPRRRQVPVPPGAVAVPTARAGDDAAESPRVVGAFRPVVGSVSHAAVPAFAPAAPGPAERVRRPRGVRIVSAGSRPRVSAERIEQVG